MKLLTVAKQKYQPIIDCEKNINDPYVGISDKVPISIEPSILPSTSQLIPGLVKVQSNLTVNLIRSKGSGNRCQCEQGQNLHCDVRGPNSSGSNCWMK